MKEKKYGYFISVFAFIFPIVILSIVFGILGVYPFGNKTALIVDLYHQYIHYYSYFTDAIKGNDSLLYSWNAGLGSNFIGDIAYYTASPLLLILLLIPKTLFPEAVLLIILAKIGLCGLSISIYIRKKFTSVKPYEVVFFSAFYALMSFNVTYYYNVMWLDGVILLPLLILSTDSIIQNKSFIPFTCFLSILIIANFYIAYMIGLFIFLYFIIDYMILLKQKSAIHNKKLILLKFIFGSCLSIGISAFLTVPTFFQLLGSLGSTQGYDYPINFNFFFKIFNGVYDSDINGSPNIYIGSFVMLLFPAFFMTKAGRYLKIKWSALFFIVGISFLIPTLNLLWHAWDIPNWFPFRYSFIFSFILLNMSLVVYEKVHTIKFKLFLFIFMMNAGILLTAYFAKADKVNTASNSLFIFLFCLIIFIKKRGLKKIGFISFLLLSTIELLSNTSIILGDVYTELGFTNTTDYSVYTSYTKAVDQLKITDPDPFYRIETDLNKTDDDSLTIGYSGFSHSSSMLASDLVNTMTSLGYYTRGVGYNKKGSTILTDSILGQKYFVSSVQPAGTNFKLMFKKDNLFVYKNKSYLPIGYPVERDLEKINPADYQNPFTLQNRIFQTVFNKKISFFNPIVPEKITYENASVKNDNFFIRQKKESPIKITYYFTIGSESDLYALFNLSNELNGLREKPTITVNFNNQTSRQYLPSQFNGVLDLGDFANEEAAIEVSFNQDMVLLSSNPLFYSTDTKIFQKDAAAVNRNAFKITQKKENTLRAKVKIANDHQLLFLSIPWDEGWNITINGKKGKPVKVLGDFIGIPLDRGVYDLQMTFIPKGLLAGGFISLFSLCVFLSYLIKSTASIKARQEKPPIDDSLRKKVDA